MAEILLAALLVTVLAIAYVTYPLVRRRTPGVHDHVEYDDELDQLLVAREGAYSAIRDLDFDYQTGKLAEADYRELRSRYAAQAVSVMQALDQRDEDAGDLALDALLEQEILDARRGLTRPAATPRRISDRTCPECGRESGADDRFCAGCGASLEDTCPACGTPFGEGDRFCAHCGAQLASQREPAPSRG